MSGKVKNKGSSNYDTQNNIMALDSDIDDQMKYKISKVMEVVKNRSQEDVMLVLQYFDYDIDTTVDAFLEDGAVEILKKWNHTNSVKPSNKNKKKKKNKKKNSIQDNGTASASATLSNGESAGADPASSASALLANGNASSSSALEGGACRLTPEESTTDTVVVVALPTEDPESRVSPPPSSSSWTEADEPKSSSPSHAQPTDQDVSLSVTRLSIQNPTTETVDKTTSVKSTTTTTTTSGASSKGPASNSGNGTESRSSISPSEYARPTNRNRHRSSSGSQSRASQESSRAEASVPHTTVPTASAPTPFTSAPGKKILEKSLKDLSRQTVALQRVSNLLEEELDNSFKRIKTAISEAQRLLEVRSQDLEQEMERVKKESRQLLNQRKDLAAELKQRAERAPTMEETALNELRADIKHFVVERKYDEELGKTCRFMWDKDRITEEIKVFGEVNHVKNSYSQRRQSVSSVASSSNMTSSITEPPELSTASQPEVDQEPIHEAAVSDTRPQGNTFPNRPRFFFRRSFVNSDSNRQGYSRGTYPPRGRGGNENRGGRGRGGRRNDDGGFRGNQDAPYYNKPQSHYASQRVDDHGAHGGGPSGGTEGGHATSNWVPREQRPYNRWGGARHNNPRLQGRTQPHHSPRRSNNNNFTSDERVPSDAHVNGTEQASDLLNGFVDH